MISQSKPHVQESPDGEGPSVSEEIKRPASEVLQNISNLKRVGFSQQSPNKSRGMLSRKVERGSKMPKDSNLASTGLRRSAMLASNPPPPKMVYLPNYNDQ